VENVAWMYQLEALMMQKLISDKCDISAPDRNFDDTKITLE